MSVSTIIQVFKMQTKGQEDFTRYVYCVSIDVLQFTR